VYANESNPLHARIQHSSSHPEFCLCTQAAEAPYLADYHTQDLSHQVMCKPHPGVRVNGPGTLDCALLTPVAPCLSSRSLICLSAKYCAENESSPEFSSPTICFHFFTLSRYVCPSSQLHQPDISVSKYELSLLRCGVCGCVSFHMQPFVNIRYPQCGLERVNPIACPSPRSPHAGSKSPTRSKPNGNSLPAIVRSPNALDQRGFPRTQRGRPMCLRFSTNALALTHYSAKADLREVSECQG